MTANPPAGPLQPLHTGPGQVEPAEPSWLLYPPNDGPHAKAMADCARAFNQGDFGGARRLARQAFTESPTAAEQEFARQILYRTGVDPVALAAGIFCLALLLAVVYWSLS
ncbi:MAG: hypothetical protein IT371_24790 [Deltaproteobacteria bacterium]|nr:hypothetical protein [Deltaproteobacteria bacterium]